MSGAEAAAAFGLAAGIIQVIGFGLQLWDATDNIRKTGSTVTTADCEREADILLKQCEEVKALQAVRTQLPESARINDIANESCAMIEEIANRLARCKVPQGSKGYTWFKDVIVHVLWNGQRTDVEGLRTKLESLRHELQFQIVISIKDRVDVQDVQRTSEFAKLGQTHQKLVNALLEGEDSVKSQLQRLRQQQDEIQVGVQGLLMLGDRRDIVPPGRENVVEELKNRLWFNAIPHRHDAITEAHSKTFEWAFTEEETTESSNKTFSEWMRKGKAFTGLRRLEGIYQGLLYKILEAAPELAELLFPDHVGGRDWGSFPTLLDMKQAFTRLLQAQTLPLAIVLVIDGLDEYDAPPGDQIDLSNILKDAAAKPHLKVLVSSRPEFAFEAAFENCMRLQLDKLTEVDRKIYVTDSLWKEPRFKALEATTEEKESLITQIVERSEGIFLWLRIVISAIQEELYLAKNINTLMDLVDDTPDGKKELPHLFEHILRKRIQPRSRSHGFMMIWVLQQCYALPNTFIPWVDRRVPYVATGLLFSFLHEDISEVRTEPMTNDERKKRLDQTALELRRNCAGLLEMRASSRGSNDGETRRDSVADLEVHFLHKDVSLFLNEQNQKAFLHDILGSRESKLQINLLECFVMVVKTFGQFCALSQKDEPIADARPDEGVFPWQLAEVVMRIAHITEEADLDRTEYALDQLDNAMSQHLSSWFSLSPPVKLTRSHWANFFPYDSAHLKPAFYPWPTARDQYGLDFLSLAIQNGLFNYVQTKLKKDPSVLSRQGLPLLSSACAPVPQWWLLDPTTIEFRTVKMLLDIGADPNEEFRGYTPWEMALLVALDSIILSLAELEELAKILCLLLQHGADTRAKVKWFEYANRTRKDYRTKQFDRSIEEQIHITFIHRFTGDLGNGFPWLGPRLGGFLNSENFPRFTRTTQPDLRAEAVDKDKFIKIGNELVSMCQQKMKEQGGKAAYRVFITRRLANARTTFTGFWGKRK
ncbi:hypothetical protein FSARC_4022 [Fusarium sarcochroum]|uniref:NACHT domain-containing protein n=1 Tax=Fusarium sarcochroum TaxID=1208366 RepID=A0A8H4U2W6_9HYPO|nr:hypothetical protein FSARC_4022 [Fusarium sarcochroum]